MRIRKRPMVPFFFASPPPQIAPDLPQREKDDRLQKMPREREELQQQEEEGQSAEANERGSGFDSTSHHARDRSDTWIPYEEMKRCCMLSSTPVPKQVEAMQVKGEGGQEDEDDKKKSARDMSTKRNGRMNCGSAETASRPLSSSREEGAMRREGENAFPFKKRKGHSHSAKETTIRKEKKMKAKLKRTDSPKKLDSEKEEEEEANEDGTRDDTSGCVKKNRGSNGSAAIEGSRCSRVNGRGWRCCQQTLVGYSLCEHHLGKGRLRNMSSVRSRASSSRLKNIRDDENYRDSLSPSPSKIAEKLATDDEQEAEKLASMMKNKKMMIMMNDNKKKRSGMKARSISSLLDQTHHATTATLVPGNALVSSCKPGIS